MYSEKQIKLKSNMVDLFTSAKRIFIKYFPSLVVIFLLMFFVFMLILTTEDQISSIFRNNYINSFIEKYKFKSSTLFSLSIGYIISTIFWFVVIVLPTFLKRKALKKNMKMKYHYFRENIARILYDSARKYMKDYKGKKVKRLDADNLADRNKFKEFFGSNDLEMYYAAINGIQYYDDIEKEVIFELNKFSDEISFFLNNIETRDQQVLDVFYRVRKHIANLVHSSTYKHDPAKYIGNYLYEIMASFSMLTGGVKHDLYEKMITQA